MSKKVKVLVIDNDTGAIKDIRDVLKKVNFKIINFKEFKREQAKGFTHIILTGGDHWATLGKFPEEVKLIKDSPMPILGICFGMQLIGKVFGSSLKPLGKIKKGNTTVKIIKMDVLFKKVISGIRVFEYHGYVLNKLGKDIEVLAKSKEGIEAIRHKSLPIWGVQFHPEVSFEGEKDGRRIIKQFLSF